MRSRLASIRSRSTMQSRSLYFLSDHELHPLGKFWEPPPRNGGTEDWVRLARGRVLTTGSASINPIRSSSLRLSLAIQGKAFHARRRTPPTRQIHFPSRRFSCPPASRKQHSSVSARESECVSTTAIRVHHRHAASAENRHVQPAIRAESHAVRALISGGRVGIALAEGFARAELPPLRHA